MAITPLPTPPSSTDAASFNTRADSFVAALPLFVTEANALAAQANADADAAAASAAASAGSQQQAAASATAAMGASHFKGAWSGLTGALQMPASVLHAGSYWVLLSDVADVAAAQPGVSSAWAAYTPTEPTVVVSGNTTATLGALHLINAGCTVTLPAATDGVRMRFRDIAGVAWTLTPTGVKIETGTVGESMTVDIPLINFELRYVSSLSRWVLL